MLIHFEPLIVSNARVLSAETMKLDTSAEAGIFFTAFLIVVLLQRRFLSDKVNAPEWKRKKLTEIAQAWGLESPEEMNRVSSFCAAIILVFGAFVSWTFWLVDYFRSLTE